MRVGDILDAIRSDGDHVLQRAVRVEPPLCDRIVHAVVFEDMAEDREAPAEVSAVDPEPLVHCAQGATRVRAGAAEVPRGVLDLVQDDTFEIATSEQEADDRVGGHAGHERSDEALHARGASEALIVGGGQWSGSALWLNAERSAKASPSSNCQRMVCQVSLTRLT